MLKQWWARRQERRAREWIRQRMHRHQLKRVFVIINEEYQRVYYEDNYATRQDFLHELVDITDSDSHNGWPTTWSRNNG